MTLEHNPRLYMMIRDRMVILRKHIENGQTTGEFHRRSKVMSNLNEWLMYYITTDAQWDCVMKMCNDYYKDFRINTIWTEDK